MDKSELVTKPFEIFDKGWALVTAGNKEKFNTMTVSWGSMGTLWSRPIVTVYIKPCRYTCDFMLEQQYFTVSTYPQQFHQDLAMLGKKSGRDVDKVAMSSLHPEFLEHGVTFKEAEHTYVLKKIYSAPFIADKVPQFAHDNYYLQEAEHIMFIGELIEIL